MALGARFVRLLKRDGFSTPKYRVGLESLGCDDERWRTGSLAKRIAEKDAKMVVVRCWAKE
jgi:hypothetical protein